MQSMLYTGSNAVQTYCGEIVKQVYDDELMETLIVKVDNFGKVDLDVIGHTLMLNGKFYVHLCVLLKKYSNYICMMLYLYDSSFYYCVWLYV